ncbi:uncharacterized protein HMPREF1541_06648 [Cyphellophora europaea CBS 101466]|uniref:Serine/threonine-protein kinase ATG1 n=1 Tax=Cyphellophora europaea (strain CBS 101466) TaxID=1220924 RepID=W2RQ07_CYPE1|nr:uncharacterized protein HMPREF1541_06648 [Cyphellophora europaea CBS 101466]ETN38611.1 hypothetical protein HMPREF1541_06648 [Cyphellophora europaea CBS 101466]
MATAHSQSSTPRRSRESERIGAFQRQEEIGRGSFATVYKAIHTNVQSIVAIKSVNLVKLNKKLRDNLTSEISILKGLHHPHIVALIDCKETSSHIHLVMEYVALGDLSQFIKKRDTIRHSELLGNMMEKYPNPRVGGLHEVVVRHFLQQLASALQFLRARNLIHRDVKPQNLLLNPSPMYFQKRKPQVMPYCASETALIPVCGIPSLPMLKIADFGFARALPPTSLAETLCGSPLYMAPEILRYEKYDAKADLWSVGTVLYEMVTSKPPFRAANHVDLLRRIEKGEDRIKFPEDVVISDPMKRLIRLLLKRDPRERVSFPDFFGHEVVVGEIPGLATEDMQQPEPASEPAPDRRRSSRTDPAGLARPGVRRDAESPYQDHIRAASEEAIGQDPPPRRASHISRQPSTSTRTQVERRPSNDRPSSPNEARPKLASHVTAPGRQELQQNNPPPASAAMARQGSGSGRPPSSLRNELLDEEQARLRQQEKDEERVAQDIAFERDYVVVEKKQIEVNAFADEMAASPRTKPGTTPSSLSPKSGAMVRRATTQGAPNSSTGAQTSASRAVQIASGRPLHHRNNSYERRYGPSPSSATSAISKALNMASGRLFGIGFSPPVNLVRGGRSPPGGYSPFPVQPGAQSSLVVIGDTSKATPLDEDSRVVQAVEEIATRSDVVYGFAEVKYKQLTPATPSSNQAGLGLRDAGTNDEPENYSDELTIEALVIVSEEALVLYVKSCGLLAKGLHLATRWWVRKRDSTGDALNGKNAGQAQQRMNNVVQWARNRFNEILEKTELVRMRLIDSQKRLPEDHPSHPNNISAETASSGGIGGSAEQLIVGSGITAEKLMYDRALEMSRSAAINELTGEDLPGCEISYITAIRMLEAVLENDEEPLSNQAGANEDEDKDNDIPINGLEAEDRKTVKGLVTSITGRLTALRKKLQVISKRSSVPSIPSPSRASPPVAHRANNASLPPASPKS